ncbi:GNAT family N-acetyltransferase [Sporosarcina aquimarina]|uniref:GNAT family N-acetyltransferase n=1 Tax=Sporosarcina aquimarina TaxID=114975 RepID=A0ABU4FXH9_9BACL|nr:GNAT family N-acetyltransferase [Sporosarcina aquimarina]MDW0109430.1 GNAT family N-acetyltransferase [Sporosarcina aquimarina]
MKIRKLRLDEQLPMDLLLLADPSVEMIEKYCDAGDCFIAESESKTIGVYVLMQASVNRLELVNVAVAEDFQERGIGKQLVLDAIKVAKYKGFSTLQVATGNSSIGQLALYQKCGFRIVGVDPDYFLIHYSGAIFENGIQCRDRIKLELKLNK